MEKICKWIKKAAANKVILGVGLLMMIGVVFLQTFCRFVIF